MTFRVNDPFIDTPSLSTLLTLQHQFSLVNGLIPTNHMSVFIHDMIIILKHKGGLLDNFRNVRGHMGYYDMFLC